jgi:hypothetical protein
MQSLSEMLLATSNYIDQQAALAAANYAEKKSNRKPAERLTAADRRARRAYKKSLNPNLCSLCQQKPRYKTKNGVAYGSLCYDCLSIQRTKRLAKKALSEGAAYGDRQSNQEARLSLPTSASNQSMSAR